MISPTQAEQWPILSPMTSACCHGNKGGVRVSLGSRYPRCVARQSLEPSLVRLYIILQIFTFNKIKKKKKEKAITTTEWIKMSKLKRSYITLTESTVNKLIRHYVCACAATWPDSDLECHRCMKCKQTSLSSVYICHINQILPIPSNKQASFCVCNILRYPYYKVR